MTSVVIKLQALTASPSFVYTFFQFLYKNYYFFMFYIRSARAHKIDPNIIFTATPVHAYEYFFCYNYLFRKIYRK